MASCEVTSSITSVLAGQIVLLIGGQSRESARQRLESQLRLRGAVHCPTQSHDASSRRFQSRIDRNDALLVVWIAGLSRTRHGECIRSRCRALRIPFIQCNRIPHPSALIDHLLRLHLVPALEHRAGLIRSAAHASEAAAGAVS